MLWAPPVLPFAAGFVSECAAAYVPASCSPLIFFISYFLLPVPGVLPWHPSLAPRHPPALSLWCRLGPAPFIPPVCPPILNILPLLLRTAAASRRPFVSRVPLEVYPLVPMGVHS